MDEHDGPGTTLAGIKVLDLTRNLAGPFATMILGDLGADVVKVEAPGRGDDTREWRPPSWNGESTQFLAANRNKRSIAVDLDDPAGAGIVRALARRSDIVIESFKPGSLDKRGLGYDALAAENPGLIFCTISAFGDVGPMAGRPGYDPVIQAYSGMMSITGEADRPPVRLPIGAIDLGTGLWCTIAIQSALLRRRESRRGCFIDTSLFEVAVWWLSYHLGGYLATGSVPQRHGTRAAFLAPYEVFPTAEGEIMVCAGNDHLFEVLCAVLGTDELAGEERFATNAERVANRDELRALLSAVFAQRSAAEWEERLLARQFPASRIRSIADMAHDPQVAALGLLAHVTHPNIADLTLVDSPVSQDGQRALLRLAPPLLGQHTDDVLGELGIAADEVAGLRARGVLGVVPAARGTTAGGLPDPAHGPR
jgi:crotonobetainyl-CoA:carnitine CoA-transferase CaiB-like acyl-CoA transferase